MGALLGAIIAGSSVWRKSKAPRRPDPAPTMFAGNPTDPTDPTRLGAHTSSAERPDR